jgi:hypothetical protein
MEHDVTSAAPTGDPQGDNADQAQRLRMIAEQEPSTPRWSGCGVCTRRRRRGVVTRLPTRTAHLRGPMV